MRADFGLELELVGAAGKQNKEAQQLGEDAAST